MNRRHKFEKPPPGTMEGWHDEMYPNEPPHPKSTFKGKAKSKARRSWRWALRWLWKPWCKFRGCSIESIAFMDFGECKRCGRLASDSEVFKDSMRRKK